MRHPLKTILFTASLAVFPALAAAQNEPGMPMKHDAMKTMPQGAAQALQMSEGIVKGLDAKKAAVTLQHGDIPGVMPAMTMGYRVDPAQQLDSIRKGDKVRFVLEKSGSSYVVTHIEAVK